MALDTLTRRALSTALLGVGATCLPATASAETALTIYSTAVPGAIPAEQYRPVPGAARYVGGAVPGYAMIRHRVRFDLEPGTNRVEMRDVAAYIDPTTVTFESLTAPRSTRVVEQSFQFDLVSAEKLMERYIDQLITVDQAGPDGVTSISGRLLAARGTLVIAGDDGRIHAVRDYRNVQFPDLPGGLITKPTLVWDVETDTGGAHDARIGYQTAGLTWWADYNLTYREGDDANRGTVDLGAWVSILNRSGATYENATLKLIAGDVHRAEPPRARLQELMAVAAAARDGAAFEQQAFFEFHLYTLGRTTTLPDDSTKQIELFPRVDGVPARKLLVYQGLAPYGVYTSPVVDRDLGLPMSTKVNVYVELENRERFGLGIPLPAGRIRVSQLDERDDTLEFIGEDVIDHTPKDETITIKLGSAFDVVGERRQVEFSVDRSAERMEETIEIKVRNHKDEPVEVIVREILFRWAENEITEASHEYEREDASTVRFPVTVPADGEAVVTYRVRYRW
ncbi:MAG: DUF4139 domain-containing protein [Gammaproteobacteria bacterium]|nr:DUF4139 domain-containing protein [Gammaproteobacteria bacterium]